MVAAFVQVMLHKGLCRLFQWIQDGPPVSDRTPTIQNGNKLTLEKNRQGWHESPFQTTKFPHPLRLVLFPQFQSRRILSP